MCRLVSCGRRKSLRPVPNVSFILCVAAVYFQLRTGCRPSEAAYLVQTRGSFPENAYANPGKGLPKLEGTWMAFMPAAETKTRRDYKWEIPTVDNSAVKLLRALQAYVPALEDKLGNRAKFTKAIEDWFVKRVVKDVAAEYEDEEMFPEGVRYNMRSVRCYRGTEWVQRVLEAKRLKVARPPNPLQHTDGRTTMRHYALPDA